MSAGFGGHMYHFIYIFMAPNGLSVLTNRSRKNYMFNPSLSSWWKKRPSNWDELITINKTTPSQLTIDMIWHE